MKAAARSMIAWFVLVIFFAGIGVDVTAQGCGFRSPATSEQAANGLESALKKALTCASAAKLFEECRWGSSADSGFAPIVIRKCEKSFYEKLSKAGQRHYVTEMQLCPYEYARQQGTISISEAATCQVELAAQYAANPALAEKPMPRTSFECAKAESPLEKAICSSPALGRADIVLARVYASVLKTYKDQERPTIRDDERNWLAGLPGKCGLGREAPSAATIACLRNEFEMRFSALDSCGYDPENFAECMPGMNEGLETDEISDKRASFDCDRPTTALQLVVCADASIGQRDVEVAEAFKKADTALGPSKHAALEESQRNWTRYVTANCPLGTVGGIPSVLTRACVRSAYEVRANQLWECKKKSAAEVIGCLNSFRILDK